MTYIAAIAVAALVVLQASGSIPRSSVGGPITIALVLIPAALAVALHEAWTKRRGPLGWIVNLVVAFFGMFFIMQLGGIVVVPILMLGSVVDPANTGSSAAAGGGFATYASLIAMAGLALFGAWGALQLVNRWRDAPRTTPQ